MDKTDLFLIMMLLANSRTTYRELASKIGLSVNAVHKRIQGLVQSGIIRTFSASLDLGMLKALTIIIFGKCQDCTVEEVLKRAQKNDAIYWISAAGGDFVYVGAHIRSISDLEPLVEYVRDELCIAEPTVGIENVQQHVCPEKELTALDYQIIRSLQKNSRKQIVDIAEELHISAKTVQRKLSNMENNRMIKFSLEWYPDKKDDIMTIFHIQLRPFSDKEEVGHRLMEKYFPNLMFLVSFSNLSQFLLAFVWTKSMKELQNLQSMFEADGAFDSVMFNILYKGLILPTWSDKLVLEKSTPPKKACK